MGLTIQSIVSRNMSQHASLPVLPWSVVTENDAKSIPKSHWNFFFAIRPVRCIQPPDSYTDITETRSTADRSQNCGYGTDIVSTSGSASLLPYLVVLCSSNFVYNIALTSTIVHFIYFKNTSKYNNCKYYVIWDIVWSSNLIWEFQFPKQCMSISKPKTIGGI